jgi:hypothetical protein
VLPPLVADMDIAVPVVHFLRRQGVDILSAREEGWGGLTDGQILARAHAMERFVLTHDADFGTLAVHRGEPAHRDCLPPSGRASSRAGDGRCAGPYGYGDVDGRRSR